MVVLAWLETEPDVKLSPEESARSGYELNSITLLCISDEVIRKRLLIEGESGADDRRINTLLKNFMKWCNTTASDEER